jgi:methionine synthase II (cobalamin-independent)
MRDDEFVYAVIPDHAAGAEDWDKILIKQDGKTHLERAIRKAFDSKFDAGVDVVIVLSSNDAVLDAASELGAVAHMVPGFFDTDSMIRTFATEPGVDIDPNDDPWVVVIDPYTLEVGEGRQMSEIKAS